MTDTIERVSSEDSGEHTIDPADLTPPRRRIPRPTGWQAATLAIGGMVAVAGGIPLLVALGVLRNPRWYPLLDLAQTELRVRDVWSENPPLVGLAGRINVEVNDQQVQGSHPGPLSFYSLWPFYVLFGATAFALQAAAASLNLLAMTTATWIAHRRAGLRLALAVAAGLAVLTRAYGADLLTEAWNPYMPMLWWVVFLLAVWSLVCHDLALLPVAVFAGSLCAQTHVPYVGLVSGLGALAATAIVAWFVPRRNESKPRRYLFFWGAPSLALGGLLWLPPIYEQFTRPRGNFWMIYESFSDPVEERPGLRTILEVWLANLDPARLIGGHGSGTTAAVSSVAIPALVLLAAWAAAVVYTWRSPHRTAGGDGAAAHVNVLRLHLVLAVALVLGLVSIARIHGTIWYYLVLWSWGTTMLLMVATGWTAFLAWRDRCEAQAEAADAAPSSRRLGVVPVTRWGTVALGVVLVASGASFAYDAAHTDIPAAGESRTLSLVAPLVVDALQDDDVVGGGQDGRYLVTWQDSLSLGSQGFGFLLEMERQGFDVGVTEFYRTGAVPHRVLPVEEATGQLTYVNGDAAIAGWDANPDATQIAFVEPRTPAQIERFGELRSEVIAWLEANGLGSGPEDSPTNLVDDVDKNLFVVGTDPRVGARAADQIRQMMDLGLPTAVYVTPL